VFEQKSSLGTVRYDSRDRETPREKIPEVAREFAALLNQGFEFTVSPSGEILRLEGMGPIIDRILEEMPLSEGPERALMKRSLENQFGDATQRNILQNLFAVLSGRRVKVGETWGKTIKVERGFPMILEHSWRLDGLCDGTAKIGIASKISSLPEARPVEMGQMRMTYDISGKQTGILELNENTRWMVRGEIKQEFSGRARAMGVSTVPDGLTWPIRVKTAVTIRAM
jgi:hypothetical protein